MCFCVGTIVAVVLTILIIYRGLEKDDLFFNIYLLYNIFDIPGFYIMVAGAL